LKNKSNKKSAYKVIIPFLVLVLSIAGGIFLIQNGTSKVKESDYSKIGLGTADELESQVNAKIEEIEKVRTERSEVDAESEKYSELSEKIVALETERSDLEANYFNVKSGKYDNLKDDGEASALPYIVGGIIMIVVGAVIATVLLKVFNQ